jgi:hypothetical protein
MRLSKEDIDTKIVELHKSGWSFRQLQKRYHKSPNYIAKLVKGIEVVCMACGKPKGKVRFHAHHPDRVNRPDYTIPLCPSCHAKEEARLRREKEEKSRAPLSGALPTTENIASKPSTSPLTFPPGPLSPTGKKVVTGIGISLVIEALFPGFFERRCQEIQGHWQHYNKSDKRPMMGLKRSH